MVITIITGHWKKASKNEPNFKSSRGEGEKEEAPSVRQPDASPNTRSGMPDGVNRVVILVMFVWIH